MNIVLNELNKLSFIIAPIFYNMLFMSISAICISVVIMLLRRYADDKISPAWKYAMWILVLVALAVPYRPKTEFALLNNVAKVQEISYRNEYDQIRGEQHNLVNIENPTPEQETSFTHLQKKAQTIFLKSLIFDVSIPLLWILGVISIALFMLINHIRLTIKLKQHKYPTSPQHIALFQKCKTTIGIKGDLPLITQNYINAPALLGIIRPKIILPLYANEMIDERVEYILLHELSHYKRFDILLNYLLLILQAVYWFNPFVWIVFKFIRQDMEVSNDTYVINVIGKERKKDYLYSLVEVLSRYNHVSFAPRLLCMVDGKNNMVRRIKMIKLGEIFKKNRIIIGILSLILICVMSVLFLTYTSVDNKDVPNMYAHIVGFSATLKTGTYSWDYGDRSVESDSLIYYEMDYSDGGTLKIQPQNTSLSVYVSTQEFAKDRFQRIPFDVLSVKRYNPSGTTDSINDYKMDDGDIMLTLPNEVGTYYYDFALKFKNGTVHYGLKVLVYNQLSAFKGLELYVWKNKEITGNDNSYFTLLQGTNRNKEYSEIYDLEAATSEVSVIGQILSHYEEGLYLHISHMNETDFTKDQMSVIADELMKYMPNNSSMSIGLFELPISSVEQGEESLTFWVKPDEPPQVIGEVAAIQWLNSFKGDNVPETEKIADYTINSVIVLEDMAGTDDEIYDFIVRVNYNITTATDSYFSPGDGVSGKGTFDGLFRELCIKDLDGGNFEIVRDYNQ